MQAQTTNYNVISFADDVSVKDDDLNITLQKEVQTESDVVIPERDIDQNIDNINNGAVNINIQSLNGNFDF